MGNAKSRVVLEHEVFERKSKYYTRSRQKSVYMQVHMHVISLQQYGSPRNAFHR